MILEMNNVTRRYSKGGAEALRGVSLRVDHPQVIGLIGRNGAGKSTLLRMIPPLIHATTGSVRVFGLDPWKHQEAIKLRIGYLSDTDVHPYNIRGRDLMDLCASVYPTWDGALAERFIGRFQLDLDLPMAALSKGQQRQVGLLATVCHRPELLILDEPAAGLDPVSRREMLNVVIELLGEAGSTVLFSSHQFADVERLAQRIVMLHRGSLLADQSLESLKENACCVELSADAVSLDALRLWRECIRVEAMGAKVIATVLCAPHRAAELLKIQFGPQALPTDIQPLGLEDLFTAWTRGAA